MANAQGNVTPGEQADELGHLDLNNHLNMTHDEYVKMSGMATTDGRNNRKGFNLTNLTIKINEVNEPGPKQKTERNHKTSLTNL